MCSELAKGSVAAGAFAHPAFLREHHFRDIKSESSSLARDEAHGKPHPANLRCCFLEPLFLSCAETDHTFDVPSRRRALDILQEEKKAYHYQLFAGVEHGFALRGDPNDPYQRKQTFVNHQES